MACDLSVMAEILTVHVPMTFRRRGGRRLIVTPDGSARSVAPSRAQIDNVLLKALARAVRWQRLLDRGTCSTIKEIASTEKIDPSYVGDVLRLTLLAPDIIEMILDGRQPPMLQFESLRKSLPPLWEEQRKAVTREQPHISNRVEITNPKGCVCLSGEVEIVSCSRDLIVGEMPCLNDHLREPITTAVQGNLNDMRGKCSEENEQKPAPGNAISPCNEAGNHAKAFILGKDRGRKQ